MTSKEKAIDVIRKLLELSKSENVNEAANAAEQAQILMTKHAINEAMLDVSPDQDEGIEHDLLHGIDGKSLPTWKGQLGVVMSEVNQCLCYRNGPNLHIVGRPSDADTVRYLFTYVAKEIDRLTILESRSRGKVDKNWSNNFRLGAVGEVNRRLKEAHNAAKASMKKEADASDTMGTGVALMRVNTALKKMEEHKGDVDDYAKKKLKIGKGRRTHSKYNEGARKAGRRAGAGIDLSSGSGKGLGTGEKKRLGS
jgi:hypothetical protein